MVRSPGRFFVREIFGIFFVDEHFVESERDVFLLETLRRRHRLNDFPLQSLQRLCLPFVVILVERKFTYSNYIFEEIYI